MKNIEGWKAGVFVGSLAVIAIIINSTIDYRRHGASESASAANSAQTPPGPSVQKLSPPPTQEAKAQSLPVTAIESKQKTPEEHAADRIKVEHAGFLAKYREPGISRESGKHMVGIAAATDDGKQNRAVSSALSQKFNSPRVKVFSSVFTPRFFSDGLFKIALDDPAAMSSNLDLADALDSLVLARETIQYSRDPSLENVVSARIQLEVTVLSIENHETQLWTFGSSGAGFKEPEARQMGEERLARQIAKDTKMALNL